MAGMPGARTKSRLQAWSARWGTWLRRLGLASVVAASLTYVPYRFADGPGAREVSRMRHQLARTRAETRKMRNTNAIRRQQLRALRSSREAIEDLAREQLGMVYPDEIVVVVESR